MTGSRGIVLILGALAALPAVGCGRSSKTSASSSSPDPAGAVTSAGASSKQAAATSDGGPRNVTLTLAEVGIDPKSLDRTADPCVDFYQFACGGWEETAKVPAGHALWTRFGELRQRNRDALRTILDKGQPTRDSALGKLRIYYAACTDQAAIEAAGTNPIDPLLAAAGRAKDPGSLATALAELHRHGITAVFSATSAADFGDPGQQILFLDSAGIGLPDREHYLIGREAHQDVRAEYRDHVQRMFALLGEKPKAARRAAAAVLRIETKLARAAKSRVERRVVAKLYNRVDRKGLTALAPRFDWDAYFAGLGAAKLDAISVTTPRFFERFDQLLKRFKAQDWAHYLQWHVLSATAATLPERFANERHAFLAKALGKAKPGPRAEYCLAETSTAIGEALGRAYVRERFGERGKETATLLLREIRAAMRGRLEENAWLSADAKAAALAKLAQVQILVGYPPERNDRDLPAVYAKSYAGNALSARAAKVSSMLARVGEPTDRNRWEVPSHRATASYDWIANRLTLPGGFLQPPFFAPRHSVPVNLGAMGVIASHELTHAFDDRGAMFDGQGKLSSWWRPEDVAAFKANSHCFVEQFAEYEILPGQPVDGKRTLSENLADLGGIRVAFAAHRKLAERDDKVAVADGFSEDQQFFLATGQAWCGKASKAGLRRLATTGTYTPPRARVNGTLANLPAFAEAFTC